MSRMKSTFSPTPPADTFTDEILKIPDDSNNLDNSLIVEPANMTASTANREMNSGDGKDLSCNETMSANNNHTTATDARIKRE